MTTQIQYRLLTRSNKKSKTPKSRGYGFLAVGHPPNTPTTITNVASLEQVRARVAATLRDGIQLDMSTSECKKLLKRHVNKKRILSYCL